MGGASASMCPARTVVAAYRGLRSRSAWATAVSMQLDTSDRVAAAGSGQPHDLTSASIFPLLDATEHASFKVSCRHQFGEFDALLWTGFRVRRRLSAMPHPTLGFKPPRLCVLQSHFQH